MPLRPFSREQVWLLPATLGELIPDDHPARFVAEFVDGLEPSVWVELGIGLDGELLGAPAYHPRALLSVWLYLSYVFEPQEVLLAPKHKAVFHRFASSLAKSQWSLLINNRVQLLSSYPVTVGYAQPLQDYGVPLANLVFGPLRTLAAIILTERAHPTKFISTLSDLD